MNMKDNWNERPFSDPVEEPKNDSIGIVDNCTAVNVRSKPDLGSSVLVVLGKGVTVSNVRSANTDFYSVLTEDGVEGYIKKDFLKLKY